MTHQSGVPHGLMFHRFRPATTVGSVQGQLAPADFETILRFVGVGNILSPTEWLTRLARGKLSSKHLCLTFDDGLRSQVKYAAPVLAAFNLQAFWFVNSSVLNGGVLKREIYSHAAGQVGGMPVLIASLLARCPPEVSARLRSREFETYARELRVLAPFYSADDLKYRFLRNEPETAPWFEETMDGLLEERGVDIAQLGRSLWMTATDLRWLTDSGHLIGLHSYDHPLSMARLEPDAQRNQYERNLADLESVTGVRPLAMSHPMGSYSDITLAILRDLGISCGFRANMHPPPGRGINPGPLELAREDAANLLVASAPAPAPQGPGPC